MGMLPSAALMGGKLNAMKKTTTVDLIMGPPRAKHF
jgi:hypothetical protein